MDPTTTSSLPTDTDDEFPLIPEELWYERLLRYGLYFGGVFQLVCILAVIFLPPGTSSTSKVHFISFLMRLLLAKISTHPSGKDLTPPLLFCTWENFIMTLNLDFEYTINENFRLRRAYNLLTFLTVIHNEARLYKYYGIWSSQSWKIWQILLGYLASMSPYFLRHCLTSMLYNFWTFTKLKRFLTLNHKVFILKSTSNPGVPEHV